VLVAVIVPVLLVSCEIASSCIGHCWSCGHGDGVILHCS